MSNLLRAASILSILALGFFACKKIDELLTFRIENESSTTIPSSSPLGLPINIATPDVESNSSQEFQNNKTDAKHVKNILLESCLLTITDPEGQHFDFVKSIHIFISTSGEDEIELASIDDIPTGLTSLALTPTTSPLDAYVKAGTYSLRTECVTRQTVSHDVGVKINSEFKVTAKL